MNNGSAKRMKWLYIALIFLTIYFTTTEACSCAGISSRRQSLMNGVCGGDVYIARVTGVTCNCIPSNSNDSKTFSCHDYRLEGPSSTLITSELINRARCYRENQFYGVLPCSEVNTGIALEGYTVQEVETTDNVTIENTTRPDGNCYLSCPFNDVEYNENYYHAQPCFYAVTVMEVIKGNYTVGQTVMSSGPDVLTSCGDDGALLKFNETYVAGVGGGCSSISQWSTLSSYSLNEILQLRDLARQNQFGQLECGAIGLLPSFSLLLAAIAISLYYT